MKGYVKKQICFPPCSPSKKRMQGIANISIMAMFVMYLLTAIFGYLTFYGRKHFLTLSLQAITFSPNDVVCVQYLINLWSSLGLIHIYLVYVVTKYTYGHKGKILNVYSKQFVSPCLAKGIFMTSLHEHDCLWPLKWPLVKRNLKFERESDICACVCVCILTDKVDAELLHIYSKTDSLILCVRLAVLMAVTLTVPVVLFPVRPLFLALNNSAVE